MVSIVGNSRTWVRDRCERGYAHIRPYAAYCSSVAVCAIYVLFVWPYACYKKKILEVAEKRRYGKIPPNEKFLEGS